jgi:threonine synthase
VAVEDELTLSWLRRLAVAEGLFVEPAAATTLAGLERAVAKGWIHARDRVACCLTGTGVKDPTAALQAEEATLIDATEQALMERLGAARVRRAA